MDRLAHTVGEQPQGAKRMLDARTGWGHPRQHPGATWIALRCGLLSSLPEPAAIRLGPVQGPAPFHHRGHEDWVVHAGSKHRASLE
jgi:hypothetical protein